MAITYNSLTCLHSDWILPMSKGQPNLVMPGSLPSAPMYCVNTQEQKVFWYQIKITVWGQIWLISFSTFDTSQWLPPLNRDKENSQTAVSSHASWAIFNLVPFSLWPSAIIELSIISLQSMFDSANDKLQTNFDILFLFKLAVF